MLRHYIVCTGGTINDQIKCPIDAKGGGKLESGITNTVGGLDSSKMNRLLRRSLRSFNISPGGEGGGTGVYEGEGVVRGGG